MQVSNIAPYLSSIHRGLKAWGILTREGNWMKMELSKDTFALGYFIKNMLFL